jgi:hypothetical protein
MMILPGHGINRFWQAPTVEMIDQYIEKYVVYKGTSPELHLVCTSVTEANQPSENIKYLVEQFSKHQIKLTIFANSYFQHWSDELSNLPCEIIYLDYFLWRVYNEVVINNTNHINLQWNSTANKFLFLTGKPNKPNRVRLLWKLYQHNLLDCAVWSLFVNAHNKQSTHNQLPELNIDDFEKFVNQFNFNPDGIEVIQNPNMDLHYGGIPYDHTLFQHTKFRVIAETDMYYPRPWITEKTWITILNKHPFILAGDFGVCKRLQDMGFKTFNEYLKIPNYDLIEDPDQRLDAVVMNAAHFLTNTFDIAAIGKDVQHNYNRFMELGEQNQTKITNFFNNLKIPKEQIDMYISSKDIIQVEHNLKINSTTAG